MIGTVICLLLMFVIHILMLVLLLDAQRERDLLRIEVDFLRKVHENKNKLINRLFEIEPNASYLAESE